MKTTSYLLIAHLEEYTAAHNKFVEHLKQATDEEVAAVIGGSPFASVDDVYNLSLWLDSCREKLKAHERFRVLNYHYGNTGGNCYISTFQVWLPKEKRTVYIYMSDEDCTISAADYQDFWIKTFSWDDNVSEAGDWFEIIANLLDEHTDNCLSQPEDFIQYAKWMVV